MNESELIFPYPARVLKVDTQTRSADLLALAKSRLSAFFHFVLDIIKISSEKMVSYVAAERVIALVQNPHFAWDRAVCQFPCNAMGKTWVSVNRKYAISMTSRSGCPVPTIIRAAFIDSFPESFFYWLTVVVSANKPVLMAWLRSFFNRLSTTARAKFGCYPSFSTRIVVIYKTQGLTFDLLSSAVCFVSYSSLLAATTMAVTIGNFVRGMIAHVVSSFQLVTMPPNVYRRCGGASIGTL